jgi:hypothetical protein
VLAALGGSCYADAGGELIWIGPGAGVVHPRAVMIGASLSAGAGTTLHVVSNSRPPSARRVPPPSALVRAHAGGLVTLGASLGPSRGLGRLVFTGAKDGSRRAHEDSVVARARPHAARLAIACAVDDAAAAVDPALALLGLGDGLTPDGDDYVGGVLFARCGLAPVNGAWAATSACIVDEAHRRTHPISARLLGDLAEGDGWTALHDLVDAVAHRDEDRAVIAARDLLAIGSSSGWDVLAGFVAGATGRLSDPSTS